MKIQIIWSLLSSFSYGIDGAVVPLLVVVEEEEENEEVVWCGGVVILNASPPPSQSDEVRTGAWICMKPFFWK